MRKTKNLLQEILIEAGSSSRDHILGGFPYTGNDLWTHLISSTISLSPFLQVNLWSRTMIKVQCKFSKTLKILWLLMMQGGRGGGGVHAAVQRCEGDQKQAEQVKTSRSGLSVFNQLSILYFLLSVLLQHSLSFVFLLSVYFWTSPGVEFMGWMRKKLWSWESWCRKFITIQGDLKIRPIM